ncbi:MAG TPA: carboxypeptidase-like regulatory domain-containing protein [Solirubrobacteraceae bacterium]|nr:carboxypeptidase-like regulatory domain-containing protein [Solirubrobacteraceae bacterium]
MTPGSIAGTVTDAGTSLGVPEIEVCAYEQQAYEEGFGEEEGEAPEGACEVTGPSGSYEIEGLAPGRYVVEFWDPGRTYVTQFYNGESRIQLPNAVTVNAGATTSPVNAALVKGGYVEGEVTSARNGEPLAEFLVCAFGIEFECAETGPGGKYRITALPTGEYAVLFLVPPGRDYVPEAKEEVFVLAGKGTTNVNAELLEGARITGTVTTPASAPVVGARACADVFEEGFLFPEECGTTGPSGGYAIERLLPGLYYVEFSDPLYPTQFYAGSASFAGSTPVEIHTAGELIPGINATMPKPSPSLPPVTQQVPAAVVPKVSVLTSKSVLPLLTVVGRVKATGHVASVKLHCGVGPCKGTLRLLATVVKRHRVHGHTVTKHVTEVLGSGSFQLAQGAFAKVKIQLNATGRRLLANAAHHPRAAKLNVTLQGAHATLRAVVVG